MREENEEDISKANLIESLQKQIDKDIFPKRVTGGLFDYCSIEPKEESKK